MDADPDQVLMVRCECGWEVRDVAERLVPAVLEHGLQAHNMRGTREQVLAQARPV